MSQILITNGRGGRVLQVFTEHSAIMAATVVPDRPVQP